MANTYLKRTGISSGNQKKWTFSGWFKRSYIGTEQRLLTSSDNSSYDDNIRFNSDNTIEMTFNNSVVLKTNGVFRDPSFYYHIVVKVDTDQASANDRIVLYINGVDERTVGGYSTSSMPNQGVTGYINYNAFYIGVTNPSANSKHFNGIMSHVHFTDAYAYTASSFGETDSTTGEWKINVAPSVTYGSNGVWLFKNDNAVTDRSGQGNNFTSVGAGVTKTEDNPSNVFATWNYVSTVGWYKQAGYVDFYNGTTKIAEAGGNYKNTTSTVGAFTGKYYFETKMISPNNSLAESTYVGVITANDQAKIGDNYNHIGETANSVGYNSYAGQVFVSNSGSNYGSALANGDILCVALDVTNKKVYFRKNADAWFNSGNPESGATGTGAVSLPTTGDAWLFGGSPRNSSIESNFGNGYFGITAVSSAGTNASNNGIFEFDVPAGFTALSTKGLNT